MVSNWSAIKVRDELLGFIDSEVKHTFLKNHPDCCHLPVSRNTVLTAACRYYVTRKHSLLDDILGVENK
jgi:hypothetical protein